MGIGRLSRGRPGQLGLWAMVVILAAPLMMVAGLPDASPVRAQASHADSLVVTSTLSIDSADRPVGEPLSGRLEVLAGLPGLPVDADIVMVLDSSGSMAGEPNQKMRDAARLMVNTLDLAAHPATRVGVVEFNSSARTLCMLTNDAGRAMACIGKIGANGGTAIDRGINEGNRVLVAGRRAGYRQIMVVLSDGENNEGCEAVKRVATAVKRGGVRVFSICVGPGCDAPCMQSLASDPGDFGDVPFFADLAAHFRELASTFRAEPAVDRLEIELGLPAHLGLVPGSAEPPPLDAPGGPPRWSLSRLDRDGFELSFELEVLGPGRAPVRAELAFDLADGSQLDHPVEAWPEGVPTPAASATPVATPTASPTPPPAWHQIWLPLVDAFG